MECKEVQKQLAAYLAGEMTEIQEIRVKKHIDACDECAKLLREEQALGSLLDQWDLELPEIDLSQRIMAEIKPPKAPVRRLRQLALLTDLIAAAAAVLLVFFSSFTLVDEIPKSIGHWSQQYLNLSLDTVDTLYKYLDDFQLLKEELFNE